jgi:hypothetical protein
MAGGVVPEGLKAPSRKPVSLLRASDGSTDASATLPARVGVVGPKRARPLWQDLPDSCGRIPGTPGPHRVSRRRPVDPPGPLEEAGPFTEIGHAEGGATHGDDLGGIRRRQAGPPGRQGHELAPVIDEGGAVFAPVVPVGPEDEFPPVQGMEGWVTPKRRDRSSGSGASGCADQRPRGTPHQDPRRELAVGPSPRDRRRVDRGPPRVPAAVQRWRIDRATRLQVPGGISRPRSRPSPEYREAIVPGDAYRRWMERGVSSRSPRQGSMAEVHLE